MTKRSAAGTRQRAFLIYAEPHAVDVPTALAREGIDVVLLVYRGHRLDEVFAQKAPGALLMHSVDAQHGVVPAQIQGKLRAATVDEIHGLAPSLARTLQMLERSNAFRSPSAILYQRYLRLVGLWATLLDDLKPEIVVINGDSPHKGFDLVLYDLCKLRGVRTVVFRSTLIDDRLIATEDITKVPGPELPELEQVKATLAPASAAKPEQVSPSDAIQRQRNNLSRLRAQFTWRGIARGLVMRRPFDRRTAPFFHEYREPRAIEQRLLAAASKVQGRRILAAYDALSEPADLGGRPYLYCPLHVQPECSTGGMADYFVDHVHYLTMLARSLPDGWRLIVKEHPNQFARGIYIELHRNAEFYEAIRSIPRVQLIGFESSAEVLARSKAVALVAGTTGWEAIQEGIPALVFGYPWYLKAPGIFPVRDEAGCRSTLAAIACGAVKVRTDLFPAYVQSMRERYTFSHFPAGFGNDLRMTRTRAEEGRLYARELRHYLDHGVPPSPRAHPPELVSAGTGG